MLHFDRTTVKHGTQNIQNDCHQWLSDSFKVHQIRFRGACSAPPRPLAGLRGPTSKGRERRRRGERGRKRGEERNRRDRPPLRKFLDPPLIMSSISPISISNTIYAECRCHYAFINAVPFYIAFRIGLHTYSLYVTQQSQSFSIVYMFTDSI